MGEENLEDRTLNTEFLSNLYKYRVMINAQIRLENYYFASEALKLHKQTEIDYINFRLDKYAGEGRKVVGEVYKILGYNPKIKSERKK